MSYIAYVPRDFTTNPDSFGRGGLLQWPPVVPADLPHGPGVTVAMRAKVMAQLKARRRAAQIQETYATRMRKSIKEQRTTAKAYANEAGISYDRFLKILRGQVIMRLEDLASADLILKDITEFAFVPTPGQAQRPVPAIPSGSSRAA